MIGLDVTHKARSSPTRTPSGSARADGSARRGRAARLLRRVPRARLPPGRVADPRRGRGGAGDPARPARDAAAQRRDRDASRSSAAAAPSSTSGAAPAASRTRGSRPTIDSEAFLELLLSASASRSGHRLTVRWRRDVIAELRSRRRLSARRRECGADRDRRRERGSTVAGSPRRPERDVARVSRRGRAWRTGQPARARVGAPELRRRERASRPQMQSSPPAPAGRRAARRDPTTRAGRAGAESTARIRPGPRRAEGAAEMTASLSTDDPRPSAAAPTIERGAARFVHTYASSGGEAASCSRCETAGAARSRCSAAAARRAPA